MVEKAFFQQVEASEDVQLGERSEPMDVAQLS